MDDYSTKGLIVAHHGISVEVLFDKGHRRTVRVKRNSGHVVGDCVSVLGETLTRLPRRTELRRADARGKVHLVAANLDVLGIVLAPCTPTGFVDRAIVAARAASLVPFLVVNKCDRDDAVMLLAEMRGSFERSVDVFPLSAVTGSGISNLEEYFSSGHRGAFIGTTGVGKSSLLNALCPEVNLKVGALSAYNSMGRHTTVVATLHNLPRGGELVDTPGFREFGLVDITAEQLVEYFPGFEKQAENRCRFRNCRHRSEPGCAVIALVECGEISRERYEIYLRLLAEIETLQTAARCREWKN